MKKILWSVGLLALTTTAFIESARVTFKNNTGKTIEIRPKNSTSFIINPGETKTYDTTIFKPLDIGEASEVTRNGRGTTYSEIADRIHFKGEQGEFYEVRNFHLDPLANWDLDIENK